MGCAEDKFLIVDEEKILSFPSSGGSSSVLFLTNQQWFAELSASEWCSVSPRSGKPDEDGIAVVTVECGKNTVNKQRTCTITLNTEGGIIISFRVTQKGIN